MKRNGFKVWRSHQMFARDVKDQGILMPGSAQSQAATTRSLPKPRAGNQELQKKREPN